MKSHLDLNLVENGKDSLRHSVEHFTADKPTDLKYAILHVFHAVELFLKARLGKAHPILIFEKPEDANKDSPRTVAFQQLVHRLEAVGVGINRDDKAALDAIRRERNTIEHYDATFGREEAKEWIGRAMRFLDTFVEEHFDFQLKDVLDPETYRILQESIFTYEERLEKVLASLPGNSPDDYFCTTLVSCDECGQETIPFPDDESDGDKIRCRFCGAEYYATDCSRCGDAMLADKPFQYDDGPNWCATCCYNMVAD